MTERRERPLEALRRKWNSSRGASILLALLFLLVCMMVGASVLMAAASNAGKIRSNQVEQQRYLTLSSALTMLCDELEQVEYYGQYMHSCTEEEIPLYDEEGKETGSDIVYHHYYRQEYGSVRLTSGGGSVEWSLKSVVPIVNDMDLMFAGRFKPPASDDGTHRYHITALSADKIGATAPHGLEITADVDETYSGLSEPVSITVSMKRGIITVSAALKDHPDYAMKATLEPEKGKEPDKALILEKKRDTADAGEPCETNPVSWKLSRIEKEGGQP